MRVNIYDTSALLSLEKLYEGQTVISPIVLSELERIKTFKEKDEHQKFLARKATKMLREQGPNLMVSSATNKGRKKILKENNFLFAIDDHEILIDAISYAKENQKENEYYFITADLLFAIFSEQFTLFKTIYLPDLKIENQKEYFGWTNYYPTSEELTSLYSDSSNNILHAKINEYCIIHEGQEAKDIIRWDGSCYKKINYKSFKSTLGTKIDARNREQKLYLDLLQNDSIPVKLCLGRFGSGKSYLALAYALHRVQKGEFDKIIFVKNNIEVKDTGKIGSLPGDEIDKLAPFLAQLSDHIGDFTLEDMIQRNIIEPIHLGFIRGRDLKNSIILVDECENLTRQHVQLLLGRVSEGSQIIFIGDQKQADSLSFEKNSGIIAMIEKLAGNPLFGMVKLIKSERSAVSALADELD